MKRVIILTCACLFIGFTVAAQSDENSNSGSSGDPTVNKRGIYILPEAGNFAIGVDATPILRYILNLNSTGNAPYFSGVDNSIYGKYYLEDNRAIRVKLSLAVGTDSRKGVVRDDDKWSTDPLSTATVVDVMKESVTALGLDFGYEFRLGEGRVQGFFGFEAGVGYSGSKVKYEYANKMTSDNPSPSTWDFYNNQEYNRSNRPVESKMGNAIIVNAGGFVGIEYFFAPKISIGGELLLRFNYSTSKPDSYTLESYNGSEVETTTTDGQFSQNPAGRIGVQTVSTGALFLMFHF
jgi:hypothetical protein